MALLASLLGFGVTIVAAILIYAVAFQATVAAIEWGLGLNQGTLSPTMKWIVVFILIFIFISLATRVGRFARDWIEAGRKVERRPARARP